MQERCWCTSLLYGACCQGRHLDCTAGCQHHANALHVAIAVIPLAAGFLGPRHLADGCWGAAQLVQQAVPATVRRWTYSSPNSIGVPSSFLQGDQAFCSSACVPVAGVCWGPLQQLSATAYPCCGSVDCCVVHAHANCCGLQSVTLCFMCHADLAFDAVANLQPGGRALTCRHALQGQQGVVGCCSVQDFRSCCRVCCMRTVQRGRLPRRRRRLPGSAALTGRRLADKTLPAPALS